MPFNRRDLTVFERLESAMPVFVLMGIFWLMVWMLIPILLEHWEWARPYLEPRTISVALPQPWEVQSVIVAPLWLGAATAFSLIAAYMVLVLGQVVYLASYVGKLVARLERHPVLLRSELITVRKLRTSLLIFVPVGTLWLVSWVATPDLLGSRISLLPPHLAPWTPVYFLLVIGLVAVLMIRARYILDHLLETQAADAGTGTAAVEQAAAAAAPLAPPAEQQQADALEEQQADALEEQQTDVLEEQPDAVEEQESAAVEEPLAQAAEEQESAVAEEPLPDPVEEPEPAAVEEPLPAPAAAEQPSKQPAEVRPDETSAAAPASVPTPAAPDVARVPAEQPVAVHAAVGWLSQRHAMVAVDLGHGAVKVLQGVRDKGGLVLTGGGRFFVPPNVYRRGQVLDPEALSLLIQRGLKELGIKGRRVAATVGGETTILRTVTFPRMTEEELKEALRWEAEKYFPFRYEEAMVDFKLGDISPKQLWPTTPALEGQIPVLLGACQRRVVTALTDALAQTRMALAELEPHPLAVFRALRYTEGIPNLSGVVAMVDIGLEGSYITIFKHGYPLFHRSVTRSVFAASYRETAEPWWSSPAVPPLDDSRVPDVIHEVGRSLEIAVMQLKPARLRVFVTGEGAASTELINLLDGHLRDLLANWPALRAENLVQPFSWHRARQWPKPVPSVLAATPPLWAGALGLLLRGLRIPVPRPDAVEPEETHAEPKRDRRQEVI